MKQDLEMQDAPTQDATAEQETQTPRVLDAYLRNIREISSKIDELSDQETGNILAKTPIMNTQDLSADALTIDMDASYEKASLLNTLDNQTQETIDLLKQEASDNIALHIALEDHLMEQMEKTQNKLRQNIGMYLEVIRQLNDAQDEETETGGMIQ